MPCRDDGRGAYEAARSAHEAKVKIDKLTRILCEVFTLMGQRLHTGLSRESLQWWDEHQTADRKRVAHEREQELETERNRLKRIADLEEEIANLRGHG